MAEKQSEATDGIVVVYAGQGKGKTTGALGTALRAVGHGLKVIVIQFSISKSVLGDGEYEFVKKYPVFELVQLGKGKTDIKTEDELRAILQKAYRYAEVVVFEGHHHLVILDAILDAIDMGILTAEDVLDLIRIKPHWVSLIFTGRRAPKEIVMEADTVTEMVRVKHHFIEGVRRPLEGLDY